MNITRIEEDSLGKVTLPKDAIFGSYTQRSKDNFPNPSHKFVPADFIRNYIRVKKIYAHINYQNQKISKEKASAIIAICKSLLTKSNKELLELIPIDHIQAGGGTSTNMFVNEVIANLSEVSLGGKLGEYKIIHPNDHVNLSQSSNDTFPGVSRITLFQKIEESSRRILSLIDEFDKFSQRSKILKVGRTHLQDAVYINFNDEIQAYSTSLRKSHKFLSSTQQILLEVNFGATATGSLQNTNRRIRKELITELKKEFGFNFRAPKSYFEITSTSSDFLKVSHAYTEISTNLIKIINDLRLLGSGPKAGFGEIIIPEVQPGSSIMPGKINPSILEAMEMVCFDVIGKNTSIQLATSHSQLQLQVFLPIIIFNLLEGVETFNNMLEVFVNKSIKEIRVHKQKTNENLNNSYVFATDYTEKLGYSLVAKLVKKALKENIPLKKLIDEYLDS